MSDTSRDVKLLEPQLQVAWRYAREEWAKRNPNGPVPFIVATHRGPIDQEQAFADGKSNARFGESLHNFKPAYAFDIAFVTSSGLLDYKFDWFEKMAAILEPIGLEWGGRWPRLVDGPHFQLFMTPKDARAGNIPTLLRVQALARRYAEEDAILAPLTSRELWSFVLMVDGVVQYKVEIRDRSVVTRVDPERKRVYVDVRKES